MIIVLTDLDGTLLDAGSQSFEAALPALGVLESLGIPVIFATSKTRAEVEEIRRRAGNSHPFIVENGGAAFVPHGYFGADGLGGRVVDGYDVVEFGSPYPEIVSALGAASRESGCRVRGFHEMSVEEVARRTGLSEEEARRAIEREYDEPFLVLEPERKGELLAAIERSGWRWTRGDAWYHLTGNNDKSSAAQAVVCGFRRRYGGVMSVGLGDSPNDRELLAMADLAFIVRSPLAAALQALVPGAQVTARSGAAGWNEAVMGWAAAPSRSRLGTKAAA